MAADAVAAAPHVTEKNRRKAAAGNRQWFPAVDGITAAEITEIVSKVC